MKNIAKEIKDIDENDQYSYLSAQEFMDDGSNIDLKIKIHKETVYYLTARYFFFTKTFF